MRFRFGKISKKTSELPVDEPPQNESQKVTNMMHSTKMIQSPEPTPLLSNFKEYGGPFQSSATTIENTNKTTKPSFENCGAFEEVTRIELKKFEGLECREIEKILNISILPSKSYRANLANKIMQAIPSVEELYANYNVKTIFLKHNGKPQESMALPPFKYMDIIEQCWETCDLKTTLEKRFFFVIFKENDDTSDIFLGTLFWTMPPEDLNEARGGWELTKYNITNKIMDEFPSIKSSSVLHVRPHAKNKDDVLPAPDGNSYVKRGFWLNQNYISKIIERNMYTIASEHKRVIEKNVSFSNIENEGSACIDINNVREDQRNDLAKCVVIREMGLGDRPLMPFFLKSVVTREIGPTIDFNKIMLELNNDNLIKMTHKGIEKNLLSLNDFIEEAWENEEDRSILKRILNNILHEKSLNNISKEKIRPFEMEHSIMESYHVGVCKKYNLDLKTFQKTVKESDLVCGYVQLKILLLDVEFKSVDLVTMPAIKKCNELRTLNEVITYVLYEKWPHYEPWESLVPEIEELAIDNHIQYSKHNIAQILLSRPDIFELSGTESRRRTSKEHSLRIRSMTNDEHIFDELNLSKYEGSCVSSYKIFVDNPDIMKLHDIDNEFELYDLIEKNINFMESMNITPIQKPLLSFNETDLNEQDTHLLTILSPISVEKLSSYIYNEYGISEQDSKIRLKRMFKEYEESGILNIQIKQISDEQIDKVGSIMVKNWYLVSEVRSIFENTLGEGYSEYVNKYSMTILDYEMDQDFIFHSDFLSLVECIKYTISNSKTFKITEEMRAHTALKRIFSKLEKDLTLIKMSDDEYIHIQLLEEHNVSKNTLRSYSEKAANFFNENTPFSLKYLRGAGFTHELDYLGFKDVFYESILQQYFYLKNTEIKNTKIFCKTQGTLSLRNIIERMIDEYGEMDIYDLIPLMQDKYGFEVSHKSIVSSISSSPMHYSNTTEKIYKDYSQYLERIKRITRQENESLDR
jgi:hypothetical protein